MPKEGFVREDGKVYWRKRGEREVWLTPEKYKQYCETRKEHCRISIREYRRRQMELPSDQRNYVGKYDPERNKFFYGISSSGKPIWYDPERYAQLAQVRKKYRRKYKEKVNALPSSNLKIGDRNPNNPEQYVTHFVGKMPRFGSIEQLQKANAERKRVYAKMRDKYKAIRRIALENLPNKRKRGDIDSVNGKIFWEYDRLAREVWLEPHTYETLRQQKSNQKKMARQKKNLISDSSFQNA